jgi:hypothetical protein
VTNFTYNNDANSVSWARAMQALTGLRFPDKGGEGVDFLDQSDATAGVDLKLPHSVYVIAGDGFATDEFQSFEALILNAFADLIDTKALANIR